MAWYSVRAVYRQGTEEDGTNLFEERILLVRTDEASDAFQQALADSKRYLDLNPTFERIGEWVVFDLSEGDGQVNEVWSSLSRSHLAPDEYYRVRYTGFELEPDEGDEVG